MTVNPYRFAELCTLLNVMFVDTRHSNSGRWKMDKKRNYNRRWQKNTLKIKLWNKQSEASFTLGNKITIKNVTVSEYGGEKSVNSTDETEIKVHYHYFCHYWYFLCTKIHTANCILAIQQFSLSVSIFGCMLLILWNPVKSIQDSHELSLHNWSMSIFFKLTNYNELNEENPILYGHQTINWLTMQIL